MKLVALSLYVAVTIVGTRCARAQSSNITISNVTGLQNALNIRPIMGTGFEVSRTAIIDSTGGLDGAVGNLTDCMHVDGTSGPCGASNTLVYDETPTGATNGTNKVFTLVGTPAVDPSTSQASLDLYRNGLRLRNTVDYVLSGNMITFNNCCIPSTGDIIAADYLSTTATKSLTFRKVRGDGSAPAAFMNQITAEQARLEFPTSATTEPPTMNHSPTYRSLRALRQRERTAGLELNADSLPGEPERRSSVKSNKRSVRSAAASDRDDDEDVSVAGASQFRSLRALQQRIKHAE